MDDSGHCWKREERVKSIVPNQECGKWVKRSSQREKSEEIKDTQTDPGLFVLEESLFCP